MGTGPYPNPHAGYVGGVTFGAKTEFDAPTQAPPQQVTIEETAKMIAENLAQLWQAADLAGQILERLRPQPASDAKQPAVPEPMGLISVSFQQATQFRWLNETLIDRLHLIREALG